MGLVQSLAWLVLAFYLHDVTYNFLASAVLALRREAVACTSSVSHTG